MLIPAFSLLSAATIIIDIIAILAFSLITPLLLPLMLLPLLIADCCLIRHYWWPLFAVFFSPSAAIIDAMLMPVYHYWFADGLMAATFHTPSAIVAGYFHQFDAAIVIFADTLIRRCSAILLIIDTLLLFAIARYCHYPRYADMILLIRYYLRHWYCFHYVSLMILLLLLIPIICCLFMPCHVDDYCLATLPTLRCHCHYYATRHITSITPLLWYACCLILFHYVYLPINAVPCFSSADAPLLPLLMLMIRYWCHYFFADTIITPLLLSAIAVRCHYVITLPLPLLILFCCLRHHILAVTWHADLILLQVG